MRFIEFPVVVHPSLNHGIKHTSQVIQALVTSGMNTPAANLFAYFSPRLITDGGSKVHKELAVFTLGSTRTKCITQEVKLLDFIGTLV